MRVTAHIAGQLANPIPSKRRLASILCDAGFQVFVGKNYVRVDNRIEFEFYDYDALGGPFISASAISIDELQREAERVSNALSRAGIGHRFEVYNDRHELAAYLHYSWPLDA